MFYTWKPCAFKVSSDKSARYYISYPLVWLCMIHYTSTLVRCVAAVHFHLTSASVSSVQSSTHWPVPVCPAPHTDQCWARLRVCSAVLATGQADTHSPLHHQPTTHTWSPHSHGPAVHWSRGCTLYSAYFYYTFIIWLVHTHICTNEGDYEQSIRLTSYHIHISIGLQIIWIWDHSSITSSRGATH